MSTKLQLIHGDVEATVTRHGGRVHRYVLNKPGLYLLLVVAGALYIGAAIIWFGGFQTTLLLQIALFTCLLSATALSVTVTYWNHIGSRRFIATSDNKLMIGDTERLWVIDWDMLDPENMGLKSMELSKVGGKLNIKVGGEQIPLLLFSPFAYLNDPHEFMATLLEHVQDEETNEEE